MTIINPYDKAHELARAVTSSDVYKNYVQAKNLIEDNPDLKEKIIDLRNRQLEVNRMEMFGKEVDNKKIEQITLDFAKLNQNPEFAQFFQAEAAFIQLFGDIQEILQKAIENGLA